MKRFAYRPETLLPLESMVGIFRYEEMARRNNLTPEYLRNASASIRDAFRNSKKRPVESIQNVYEGCKRAVERLWDGSVTASLEIIDAERFEEILSGYKRRIETERQVPVAPIDMKKPVGFPQFDTLVVPDRYIDPNGAASEWEVGLLTYAILTGLDHLKSMEVRGEVNAGWTLSASEFEKQMRKKELALVHINSAMHAEHLRSMEPAVLHTWHNQFSGNEEMEYIHTAFANMLEKSRKVSALIDFAVPSGDAIIIYMDEDRPTYAERIKEIEKHLALVEST